jgi:cytochrome P450
LGASGPAHAGPTLPLAGKHKHRTPRNATRYTRNVAVSSSHEGLSALLASKPEALGDPWPVWQELREAAPVVEFGALFFVTRHAEVKSVLRDDTRLSSSALQRGGWGDSLRASMTAEQQSAFHELGEFSALTIVSTDSDVHERLRRIAHRAFTPRRIAELEAATVRYVDDIVTELAEQEVCDLMQLAYRAPLMIIGDLLGVPDADRESIKEWSNAWFQNLYTPDDRIFLALEAQRNFRGYVEGMIEEHRRAPGSTGLVAALMGAEQDEQLTPEELTAMFFILLFAGHETTTNLIGTGMLELLRNRDQWELLSADPELVPAATEELLRYVTPVQWLTRFALEDIELGDATIPAGGSIMPVLASANRDPDVFSEPDVLNIRRPDVGQHIALGFGRHFCLGASLARLEGTIAFRTLARRFPGMELATDDFGWRGTAQLRSLSELKVRLGPEQHAA